MTELQKPTKNHYYAVEFKFNDPDNWTTLNVTDAEFDIRTISTVLAGSKSYFSVPELKIEKYDYEGTLDTQPFKFSLPESSETAFFTDKLKKAEVHSPIYVSVWQISKDQTLYLYKGRCLSAETNFKDTKGLVGFEVESFNGVELKSPMSIRAIHQCRWIFAHSKTCKATPISETRNISSVDGKTITVGVLGNTNPLTWLRGYVTKNGLNIGIRKVNTSTKTFTLNNEPPSDWVTTNVVLHAGCNKELTTCINRWGNEANFMGIGYAMPSYNPLVEDPGA